MTPNQIQVIEDGIKVRVSLLRVVHSTRATVRVSWAKQGLLDTDFPSTHIVTIDTVDYSVSGYPLTLTGSQAYDIGYSVIITDWDPTRQHVVVVNVNNEVSRTYTVKPFLNIPEKRVPNPIDPSSFRAKLTNTLEGIKIQVGQPCNPCMQLVRNIIINKRTGPIASFIPFVVSSVPVPLTISTNSNDYSTTHIDLVTSESNSTTLPSIMNTRDKYLFSVELSGTGFTEVIEQSVLKNKREEYVVYLPSEANLELLLYPNKDVLYYIEDNKKYYRYRPTKFTYPLQGYATAPTTKSTWGEFTGFTQSSLTSVVYINGTGSSPSDTATIVQSVMNEVGSYTSFNTNPQVSSTLHSLLPVDTLFMDTPTIHVDSTVVPGEVYTYEVYIELLDGASVKVFTGGITRRLPTIGSLPDNTTVDHLRIAANEDTELIESDFQSGPANGNLKVTLSDDPKDYVQYIINKTIADRGSCLI